MLSSEAIVAHFARYLLQLKEGDRVQSVRNFARAHQASLGTISNALAQIEGSGAVTLERRGHLGSFVLSRSIGALWQLAEGQPLVISFPLIAHPRLEGLATSLKKHLSAAGIDVYLMFIRGSRTRMKALREGRCHIAVMSHFAADALCTRQEEAVLTLPAESYVGRHAVFYRPQPPAHGRLLRVAVDRDSFDVEGLTKLEFADQVVEYKPVTFMQLPRLLKGDYVDAGIWSVDDMSPHVGEHIAYRPLSPQVLEQVQDRDTSAALVIRADNASVRAVAQSILQAEAVLSIQRLVMDGEMVPEY
ncbi:MAG: hypothetical protein JNM70_06415 [Anaerolineae bacterium]|nr:hypothetical protein [Anaerolineae bacterium]